ncbi:MAG: phosphate-starvation-inducible PsiE family protein, partial [Desulfuromonadales bacterium]
MKFAENFIYIFVAINLIGAAIFLLFWAVWIFFSNIDQSPHSIIPSFLDSLLLVLMIVEILYTVGIFLKDRKLVMEPFLAV